MDTSSLAHLPRTLIRIGLSVLVFALVLAVAGCAGLISASAPEYEITRSDDYDMLSVRMAYVEVDTQASERDDLRATAREITDSEEYEGYDALEIGFTDSSEAFADRGLATAVMSRAGIESVGADSELLQELEQDGDGIYFLDEYSEVAESEGPGGLGMDYADEGSFEEDYQEPVEDVQLGEAFKIGGFEWTISEARLEDERQEPEQYFGDRVFEGPFVVLQGEVTNLSESYISPDPAEFHLYTGRTSYNGMLRDYDTVHGDDEIFGGDVAPEATMSGLIVMKLDSGDEQALFAEFGDPYTDSTIFSLDLEGQLS